MKGLFRRPAFVGFGPPRLAGVGGGALERVRGSRPSRLRAGVRARCPRQPGVYGMVDALGELIYVGKAKSLRGRLMSYFRPNSRDPKAGRIVADARQVVWETTQSEFGALLRELELIRAWQPRHNVQGQPKRMRRVYVCLGRRPAPYAFVAARPPGTALASYGPLPGARRAREAARRLNDWFGLRDCPQAQEVLFADQRELFPLPRAPGCLRYDIGHCLAPCAAGCTADGYGARVGSARAFLEGADDAPLGRLERDMAEAAAALAFERAGVLRDKLDVLRWLSGCLKRLREAAVQRFVYPVAGADGREVWYLVRDGRVRAALPAPADERALEAVYGPAPAAGPPGPDEVDEVLLVAGWFRRHREERGRTLTPEEALGRARKGVVLDGPLFP